LTFTLHHAGQDSLALETGEVFQIPHTLPSVGTSRTGLPRI
jgi:hypothetical protein